MTDAVGKVKRRTPSPALNHHAGKLPVRHTGGPLMTEGLRAEMIRRIDVLDRCLDRLAIADLAAGLEGVRRVAAANDMHPTVDIIHLLGALLAEGQRGPLVHDWFAVLRESASVDLPPGGRDSLVAACTVRLSA